MRNVIFVLMCVSLASAFGGEGAVDKRPKILIVSAEDEYKTAETLPVFAKEHLEKDYAVTVIIGGPRSEHRLKGIEQIKDADIILLAMRRRLLVKEELDLFRAHVAAGKAVISIRTSLHAFSPMAKEKTIPEGCDAWLDFDKTILGCNYQNHHGAKGENKITLVPAAKDNPLLRGVEPTDFVTSGTLYKVAPLDPKAVPLLKGTIPDAPSEFVAWTLERMEGKQRVFVTALGHPDDFKLPQFVRLLRNGIDWCAGK